jgi:phosphotransferase system enzyme I (PtsP)
LANLVSQSQDTQGFLQSTVELVSRHLDAEVCSIYLSDEFSGDLILKATVGLNPRAVGQVRMKPGEGLVGTAFETLQPIREARAQEHPRFKYFKEADEDRFNSFLAVPIYRGVQKIGVLAVQHEQEGYFTEIDTMALRASASQLASSLENVRLLMDLGVIHGEEVSGPHIFETLKFIKGQTASEGFASGPSTLFKKSHVALLSEDYNREHFYSVENFRMAVKKTSEELMSLQSRLAERLPESASLIFTAHFMILKDHKFMNQILSQIQEGTPVPDAIRNVAKHYIGLFSSNPHAYIREKVSDIEDLTGRILKNLFKIHMDESQPDRGSIVIAAELYPSEILKLASGDVQGIILVKGGVTSHVSILARSLKIPMIIADMTRLLELPEGTPILMDARSGNVFVKPDNQIIRRYESQEEARKAAARAPKTICPITHTRDGVRVRLMANINLLSEIKSARDLCAEGVGLYRTEFPFIVRPTFPSEEEQYMVYKRLADEMGDREINIRTLDISGDKALVYSDATKGANPDLGLRSIRFSMRHPSIFEQQIRAILRAGAGAGDFRIMFPLISSLDEFLEARQIVYDCIRSLERDNLPHHPKPAIGVMVEVPSLVEIMDAMAAEADFFSIGTNDFVQYTLAVDRSNEKVADYYRPYHPAVLRGLARIVKAAVSAKKDISICGEMGHDLIYIPFLLGIGVRRFSVDPQFLPVVQERVSSLSLSDAEKHAEMLLAQNTFKAAWEILDKQAGL